MDEGVYLGCREGAAPSLLPGTGDVGSFWSPGLVFEEACKVQKHLPTLCATKVWTMICSHHVVELLKENHRAPQPSQLFLQTTAHPLRDP